MKKTLKRSIFLLVIIPILIFTFVSPIKVLAKTNFIVSNPSSTTHQVTFNLNGGTWTDAGTNIVTVDDGAKVNIPTPPTKEGCVFAGWFANAGLNVFFDFENTTINNDEIIIYAMWNEIVDVATVTVTEPVAGETPSYNPTVGDSSKYWIDDNETKWTKIYPTSGSVTTFEAGCQYAFRVLFRPKVGYTFSDDTVFLINGHKPGQWGDSKAMALHYFATIDNNSNINVLFHMEDGETPTASISIKKGSLVPKPENPTRNGYTFVRWETAQGYIFDFNEPKFSNPTELFAVWVENENLQTNTIILNPNNGTEETQSITNIANQSIINLGTLEKYGFTVPQDKEFYGWKVGNELYLPGEYFEVTSNQTAVAQYIGQTTPQSITHTVTFNLNGGTWTYIGTNEVTVDDGIIVLQPAIPSKDGYIFKGWYSDSLLLNPFDFSTPITEDKTLYAKWNIAITEASATVTAPVTGANPDFNPIVPSGAHYTITVDTWYLHESPYPSLNNESTFIESKEYSLRVHFIPNTGYEFTNSTIFTINGETIAKYGSIGDREYSKIATAPITYSLSFDSNGGTGTMADVTGLTGSYTLPANGFAAPENKQFKGWSLTSDGAIITSVNMTENKTVYAIWEDIPATVYTILDGNNQTYTKGSNKDIIIRSSGDKDKIISIEIDGGNVIDPSNYTLETGSTILKLKSSFLETSSIGVHTITFKYNDGEVDAHLTITGELNQNNNIQNNNTNTNNNQNENTITASNPKTSDNIINYMSTLLLSIIGIVSGIIYSKKKKQFNK